MSPIEIPARKAARILAARRPNVAMVGPCALCKSPTSLKETVYKNGIEDHIFICSEGCKNNGLSIEYSTFRGAVKAWRKLMAEQARRPPTAAGRPRKPRLVVSTPEGSRPAGQEDLDQIPRRPQSQSPDPENGNLSAPESKPQSLPFTIGTVRLGPAFPKKSKP